MFNNLYKLYRNSSIKTPLEDFNTECFVGILNLEPSVLDAFVVFLGLEGVNYTVTTQGYYSESKYPTCFIDLVLENNETICFIENKVNSSEGINQLNKYDGVLQSINKKNKKLRYITKWSDNKKGFTTSFNQYRWYDIADWLFSNFKDLPIVMDYYSFLKTNNMALKKEITTDCVIALKNFNQAYTTAKLHLDKAAEIFSTIFPKSNIESGKMSSYKEIVEGNRITYHIFNLFEEDKKYHTEVLIQFHIASVSYRTQIWMNPKHIKTKQVEELAIKMDCFDKVRLHETGFVAYNSVKLYQFIDKEDTDGEIASWFRNSLNNIKKLIESSPELNWEDKLI